MPMEYTYPSRKRYRIHDRYPDGEPDHLPSLESPDTSASSGYDDHQQTWTDVALYAVSAAAAVVVAVVLSYFIKRRFNLQTPIYLELVLQKSKSTVRLLHSIYISVLEYLWVQLSTYFPQNGPPLKISELDLTPTRVRGRQCDHDLSTAVLEHGTGSRSSSKNRPRSRSSSRARGGNRVIKEQQIEICGDCERKSSAKRWSASPESPPKRRPSSPVSTVNSLKSELTTEGLVPPDNSASSVTHPGSSVTHADGLLLARSAADSPLTELCKKYLQLSYCDNLGSPKPHPNPNPNANPNLQLSYCDPLASLASEGDSDDVTTLTRQCRKYIRLSPLDARSADVAPGNSGNRFKVIGDLHREDDCSSLPIPSRKTKLQDREYSAGHCEHESSVKSKLYKEVFPVEPQTTSKIYEETPASEYVGSTGNELIKKYCPSDSFCSPKQKQHEENLRPGLSSPVKAKHSSVSSKQQNNNKAKSRSKSPSKSFIVSNSQKREEFSPLKSSISSCEGNGLAHFLSSTKCLVSKLNCTETQKENNAAICNTEEKPNVVMLKILRRPEEEKSDQKQNLKENKISSVSQSKNCPPVQWRDILDTSENHKKNECNQEETDDLEVPINNKDCVTEDQAEIPETSKSESKSIASKQGRLTKKKISKSLVRKKELDNTVKNPPRKNKRSVSGSLNQQTKTKSLLLSKEANKLEEGNTDNNNISIQSILFEDNLSRDLSYDNFPQRPKPRQRSLSVKDVHHASRALDKVSEKSGSSGGQKAACDDVVGSLCPGGGVHKDQQQKPAVLPRSTKPDVRG